jgi:hypothetical protein
MVELLFISIVLYEELVESAVAISWKYLTSDVSYGLVAASNKTCDVDFRMMSL